MGRKDQPIRESRLDILRVSARAYRLKQGIERERVGRKVDVGRCFGRWMRRSGKGGSLISCQPNPPWGGPQRRNPQRINRRKDHVNAAIDP